MATDLDQEAWQRRYDARLDAIERQHNDRMAAVEKDIGIHKAECELRHRQINDRFDRADKGRETIFGEIKELRGELQANHAQNSQAITNVQLGQSSQWVRIAGAAALAVLAAGLAGAIGYLVKH